MGGAQIITEFTWNKVGPYSGETNRDVLMPERSSGINISRFILINKVPVFPREYVIFFFKVFLIVIKVYLPREIKLFYFLLFN